MEKEKREALEKALRDLGMEAVHGARVNSFDVQQEIEEQVEASAETIIVVMEKREDGLYYTKVYLNKEDLRKYFKS